MSFPSRIVATIVALVLIVPAGAAWAAPPVRSWPEYLAVKAVVQQMAASDERLVAQRDYQGRHSGGTATYDLVNCVRGGDYAETQRVPEIKAYADIALDVISWRSAFRRFGFPPALWQQSLIDYEQTQVDRTIAGRPPGLDDARTEQFQNTMMARLNGYGAAHPGYPRFVLHGGCGAGEGSVLIATVPLGAQVLFIPTFFYQLCKVQHQNADDPGSCPRWREALEGKLQSVAGDYLYRARWPDGTIRRGTLRFDMGDDGKTITLRKP